MIISVSYQRMKNQEVVLCTSTKTEAVGHVGRANFPLIAGVLEQGRRNVMVTRIVGLDLERQTLEVEPGGRFARTALSEARTAAVEWTTI